MKAFEPLTEFDLRLISPRLPAFRGPLIAYELPEVVGRLGYGLSRALLQSYRLQVTVSAVEEKWALRISPHIYNTEAEIQTAAARLTEYLTWLRS